MNELLNPERSWAKKAEALDCASEVKLRLGAVSAEFELLSGGLANTNIRLGQDRVLRIYRQDPARLRKEQALLMKPWQSFKVPEVLQVGKDFLVLSYVPHQRLNDSPEHGEAVGRALAEIHAIPFECWGLMDDELNVKEKFPDLVDALSSYAGACFDGCAPEFAAFKEPVLAFLKKRRADMAQATGKPCLVHSDFKVSNVHWTPEGRPLILDWETAYSGSPLSDMGQLFRWRPSSAFRSAFERGYGALRPDWLHCAEAFDLINLVSLFKEAERGSKRGQDLSLRVQETLRSE